MGPNQNWILLISFIVPLPRLFSPIKPIPFFTTIGKAIYKNLKWSQRLSNPPPSLGNGDPEKVSQSQLEVKLAAL